MLLRHETIPTTTTTTNTISIALLVCIFTCKNMGNYRNNYTESNKPAEIYVASIYVKLQKFQIKQIHG